jgi:hypothetical protein
MTRTHTVNCHGALDAIGDFIEAILRSRLLRRFTARARRRLSHARRWW